MVAVVRDGLVLFNEFALHEDPIAHSVGYTRSRRARQGEHQVWFADFALRREDLRTELWAFKYVAAISVDLSRSMLTQIVECRAQLMGNAHFITGGQFGRLDWVGKQLLPGAS